MLPLRSALSPTRMTGDVTGWLFGSDGPVSRRWTLLSTSAPASPVRFHGFARAVGTAHSARMIELRTACAVLRTPAEPGLAIAKPRRTAASYLGPGRGRGGHARVVPRARLCRLSGRSTEVRAGGSQLRDARVLEDSRRRDRRGAARQARGVAQG